MPNKNTHKKARKPPKSHPWRVLRPYTTSPTGLKVLLGYLAEQPYHKTKRTMVAKNGEH